MKKYPRTYHLSFSPEIHSDDKTMHPIDEKELLTSDIVITLKLDGGNCCLKPSIGVFARSHAQSTDHPSFDLIKNTHFYAKNHILNSNYHYFGENLYAIHSIEYTELEDFFYLFAIYNTVNDEWLSYEEIIIEAKRCGFLMPPAVFSGKSTPKEIKKLLSVEINSRFLGAEAEGFVIRKKEAFKGKDFSSSVAKFVREGHVQTDEHWSRQWKTAKLKKG